jgi:hypothetical protein
MTRKNLSAVWACALAIAIVFQQTASANPAFDKSTSDKETRLAQKVKTGVLELGTGQSTRVSVKLRDKTMLAGYISEIADNSFAITDPSSAVTTTVPYPDVVQVKGNNLSTGAKIAIAAGIIAGIVITLYIVRGAFCDGC